MIWKELDEPRAYRLLMKCCLHLQKLFRKCLQSRVSPCFLRPILPLRLVLWGPKQHLFLLRWGPFRDLAVSFLHVRLKTCRLFDGRIFFKILIELGVFLDNNVEVHTRHSKSQIFVSWSPGSAVQRFLAFLKLININILSVQKRKNRQFLWSAARERIGKGWKNTKHLFNRRWKRIQQFDWRTFAVWDSFVCQNWEALSAHYFLKSINENFFS